MRHRKKRKQFARSKEQRKALFNTLASSLILKEKITTTEAKAKQLRSLVEKSITRAKKDNLSNRRLLARNFSKPVLNKLFKELGPRYKQRKGGYTRIVKLLPRKSDAAKMAVIEFVK